MRHDPRELISIFSGAGHCLPQTWLPSSDLISMPFALSFRILSEMLTIQLQATSAFVPRVSVVTLLGDGLCDVGCALLRNRIKNQRCISYRPLHCC